MSNSNPELLQGDLPKAGQAMGRLVARCDRPSPAEHILPLRKVDIKAIVTGPLASVRLSQTFANDSDEAAEAVYIFPLSAGAAVHEFRMRVGERVIEGEIQEKQQARKTYAEGKAGGQRTALVEQERDNVFTMTVGNIAPGEEVIIELGYAERLESDEAQTILRLPLVVAPRYIPGQILGSDQGLGVAHDTDQVSDASRISPPVGEGNSPVSLNLEVELETGGLLPHYLGCSQHALSQRNAHGNLIISLARHDELLDRDFVLRFNLAQEKAEGLLLTASDHFMLWVNPPSQSAPRGMPRDVVFLVDHSGSMSGAKMESARKVVVDFLGRLGSEDRFNVLAFDDRMDLFAPTWCPLYRLPEARIWVDTHCRVGGGTEILRPIQWLLDQPAEEGRLMCAVLITDGEMGNEPQVYAEIQGRLKGTRLFTLGIDTAVNDAFLRQVAHLGRGTCEMVTPGELLEAALERLAREIGAPLITDLQWADHGLHADLQSLCPFPIPDLFAARPVVVSGKKRGEGDVTLSGRHADGAPWSVRLSPTASSNPALAILWARQRIRHLEDRLRLGPSHQRVQVEAEIRALALEYGLLSKYTSFVLVDRSEVVNPSGQCQTVVQPVHLPAQWQPQDAQVEETVKDITAQDFGALGFDDEELELDRLKEMVDEAPIVRVVNLIISQAINDRASHIHIEGEAKAARVRYRVEGTLHEVMSPPKHIHAPLVARIKTMAGLDVMERRAPQSGIVHLEHSGKKFQLLVSTCPTLHGERVVIQIVDPAAPLPRLEDFGPTGPRLAALAERSRGLILVAGPAGSGRSTLVAKLLSVIQGRNVMHYDPGFPQQVPGVNRTELRADLLPTLVRQDTDVVGVSQCWRSQELGLLVEMAASRSLVLAAWLGEDIGEARARFFEAAPEPHLARAALSAIVVLRAFPRLCSCNLPDASPDLIHLLGDKNWRCRGGCDRCHSTGLKGRVWTSEILEFPPTAPCPTLREQALRLAEEGVIEARALGPWLIHNSGGSRELRAE